MIRVARGQLFRSEYNCRPFWPDRIAIVLKAIFTNIERHERVLEKLFLLWTTRRIQRYVQRLSNIYQN